MMIMWMDVYMPIFHLTSSVLLLLLHGGGGVVVVVMENTSQKMWGKQVDPCSRPQKLMARERRLLREC